MSQIIIFLSKISKWIFPVSLFFSFSACENTFHYKSFTYSEDFSLSFSDILVPKIIMDTYRIRNFIAGDYYHMYRKENNDIESIDELYNYALYITDNNIQESLFIISVSTLPYKKTPAKFPVLKFDMMFYFSFESDSMFTRRYKNLPSVLFEDTPAIPFGDRDKTPHFFGSAYLAYISDSRYLSGSIGYLIEIGEYLVEFEGFMDPRDMRTNKAGARFGMKLLRNPETLPSQFLGKIL